MHACVRTVGFAGNRVWRPSAAVIGWVLIFAVGIATLGHEIGDHAVKCRAIVLFVLGKADKISDRIGSLIFK